MKTAVEWLLNEFQEVHKNYGGLDLGWLKRFEQANEMFEQQIIDFADNYVDNCVIPNENMAIPTIMGVSQYYLETFKKNNI
jgi:hypothetical protein